MELTLIFVTLGHYAFALHEKMAYPGIFFPREESLDSKYGRERLLFSRSMSGEINIKSLDQFKYRKPFISKNYI